MTPEQEYLELLRKRIDMQDKLIQEIGKQVKMLADSLNGTVKMQNEIARQVVILTEALAQLQDVFAMPEPDYRFFTTDDPYN